MEAPASEPLVYVPAGDEKGEVSLLYEEARVLSRADGAVTLETLESGEVRTLPAEQLLYANELPEEGVEDMTRLNYLHEPALLANLRHRFARDHVYTYTGKICIAVNPFNWQVSKPLYVESLLRTYRRQALGELPPHVYAIAEDAYQRIADDGGSNQSVLVSGESGAGKTESVKIMMQYLAVVSMSGSQNRVASQVMATNPLLEAFGNARTSRNNNSSRFGKFIEIQFDSQRRMSGARIHIYLLEKSRVVQQASGERNYHVFYQLLRGLSAEDCAASYLDVLEMEQLRLVNQSGCTTIDGVDDGADLQKTREAMAAIDMGEEERHQVLRTLAAVLLLAQLEFDQDGEEHSSVAGAAQPLLEQAAELVAIEPADLSHALCTRRLVTRDDVVTVPLNREQSGDSRDALAKALYGKLFSWLVERCNEKLVDDSASTAFVGILDIFGFEQFQTNSFEQLCINYANERLQQQFNWDIFKAEQAEYEAEGIEWQAIEFVDNQECLDLIDKKSSMGLLHLLDEECKIQRGTDEKFAQKARQTHAEHKDFDAPKGDQLTFAVKHYAGCVAYLCSGFREKNKDTLHQDLAAVMQQSQAEVVLALFPSEAPERESKRAGKPKAKGSDTMTVGSQFMTQLSSLMRTINATDVHYVRCIKPNTLNKPAIFDMAHSAHQLRCAGVLEAVRISRMAYPNRMPHASFVSRYALLAPSEWQAAHEVDMARARAAAPGDESARALCEGALALVVEDVARYQLGKTKVFFRAFLLEALEQRRGNALATYAVVVQKMLRSALWSRRFRLLRLSSVRLQALRRRQVQLSEYRRQRAAAIALAAAGRGLRARILRRRLLAAVRIQAAGRAAAARDRVYHLRRRLCATRLQAAVRSHRHRSAFTARRGAALRLQSKARMASQRRAYLRDLAEKKEEAKLSTQLAKLQARLQAEMEARQNAERALEAGAAADEGSGSGAAVAGDGGGVAGIAGAAASWVLGNMGGPSTSVEETSTMLSVVTKDRERLGQRLAAETEARKRLEAEKRELERKLNMGSATSQVETRSHRQIAEALSRTKDEVGEKTRIMQNQTIEIANLQNTKTALERRILALEKKISQYDDSFYALEARNVRDKTRMEEMGKAKSRAEEEKNICRLMLEQAHERWLKERSDLRKDALQKIQTNAARVREQRMQIAELQQAHRAQRQLAEEAKMYKEQCTVLMEKLSRAGVGGGTTPAASPGGVPSPRARPGGAVAAPLKAPSAANLLEKMKSSVSSSGLLGRATSKESPRAPPPAPDAP